MRAGHAANDRGAAGWATARAKFVAATALAIASGAWPGTRTIAGTLLGSVGFASARPTTVCCEAFCDYRREIGYRRTCVV